MSALLTSAGERQVIVSLGRVGRALPSGTRSRSTRSGGDDKDGGGGESADSGAGRGPLMTRLAIHRVLVLDGGRLCGILTSMDLVRAAGAGRI